MNCSALFFTALSQVTANLHEMVSATITHPKQDTSWCTLSDSQVFIFESHCYAFPVIPRHIIIKMLKCWRQRILKAAREKQLAIYKETPDRLLVDLSAETLQARREWHYVFQVIKGKTYNQEYSTWQSFTQKLKVKYRVS